MTRLLLFLPLTVLLASCEPSIKGRTDAQLFQDSRDEGIARARAKVGLPDDGDWSGVAFATCMFKQEDSKANFVAAVHTCRKAGLRH